MGTEGLIGVLSITTILGVWDGLLAIEELVAERQSLEEGHEELGQTALAFGEGD